MPVVRFRASSQGYGVRRPRIALWQKKRAIRPFSVAIWSGTMLFGTCNCHLRSPISRRGLLCASGAGFVSALIGTLAGNARTARAQTLGSNVPEVDRVAVRIVTDNQVIQFIPSEKRDGLTIERRTGANLTPDAPPRTALHGEWGLSMHVESQRANEVRNVLVDFGYTPERSSTTCPFSK
jgi:7,8-dihydropterin-6-yl-methyl-4-(beta-D-ribofuranosyl)aminobenzene 5'-phosphate synthase